MHGSFSHLFSPLFKNRLAPYSAFFFNTEVSVDMQILCKQDDEYD